MKIKKSCQRSGRLYQATGPAQKYCGRCPECKAATNGNGAGETPRPRVDTGYRAPANGGGLSSAIGNLKLELEAIDSRRIKIVAAIESLEQLEGADQ